MAMHNNAQQTSANSQPLAKQQCWLGFSVIVWCWRTTDNHRRACIPTKTFLKNTCQLAVTVRNESLQHGTSQHSNDNEHIYSP